MMKAWLCILDFGLFFVVLLLIFCGVCTMLVMLEIVASKHEVTLSHVGITRCTRLTHLIGSSVWLRDRAEVH